MLNQSEEDLKNKLAYEEFKTRWTQGIKSSPPSGKDYQTFVLALENSDGKAVGSVIGKWTSITSDSLEFLSFIEVIGCELNTRCKPNINWSETIHVHLFKALWPKFYSAVVMYEMHPHNGGFAELIAAITAIMKIFEKFSNLVSLDLPLQQLEGNVLLFFAEIWSRLAQTCKLNSKLVNALPWRDVQLCLTQKLVTIWTYTQFDTIRHTFVTNLLQFHDSLPAYKSLLTRWSILMANKREIETNFTSCIASMGTVMFGMEKHHVDSLNKFKSILEGSYQPGTGVNKSKKGPKASKSYSQLEMMNDIHSLRRILRYLGLAMDFQPDSADEDGSLLHVFLVERVLQVTGECLKNTAGSPNLSEKKRKMLEKANLPLQSLSELRNALSHYNCLTITKIKETEKSLNLSLILHELKKLEQVFTKVLHRIEFTLLLKLIEEESNIYGPGSAEAQFLISLRNCDCYEQLECKIMERFSDDYVKKIYFLIQQFNIQSKVFKMERLSFCTGPKQADSDFCINKPVKKEDYAESTLSKVSDMIHIENLLQDITVSSDNSTTSEGGDKLSPNFSVELLRDFEDSVVQKHMSKEFYCNTTHELLLGIDFPVALETIERYMDMCDEKEFATKEDKRRAISATSLLDTVLHLKICCRNSADQNNARYKERADEFLNMIAKARDVPVTETQVELVCQKIGIDNEDVQNVLLETLQDMFDSIPSDADNNILSLVEKVITECCSTETFNKVCNSKENVRLKTSRIKLITFMKAKGSKQATLLTESEFNTCKAEINNHLSSSCQLSVTSTFDCSNGRIREIDLKILKQMASPFEKLKINLKENKSLEASSIAFKKFLEEIGVPDDEKVAATALFRSIEQDGLEAFVLLRIVQMKKLFEKNEIPISGEIDGESFAIFKRNLHLRAAVEMILLECLEILENLHRPPNGTVNYKGFSFSSYKDFSITSFRNYLAHGDSLQDFYNPHLCNAILMNAVGLIINGECIMALRKLFEDDKVYRFIRQAELDEELHTVHAATISSLADSSDKNQIIIAKLQSISHWKDVVKFHFRNLSMPSRSSPCTLAQRINVDVAIIPSQLMAEEALTLLSRNQIDQFSILVDANPDICMQLFRNSWTLLHYAMFHKQNAQIVIQILVKYGADVNSPNDWNLTPLHLAVLNESVECTAALLSCPDIKVNAASTDGVSALHIAVQQGSRDIVEVLLKSGANVNAQTRKRWSALHFACSYGYEEIANLLLQNGASPNLPGEHKWTALHLAVHHNHIGTMRTLLDNNANPYAMLADDVYHVSQSVVHLAASFGNLDCIQLLIDRGIPVNFKSPSYKYGSRRTPLHLAALYGNEDVIRFLLAHTDADKHCEDDEGITALDYALRHHHLTIADFLLQQHCVLKPDVIVDAAAKGDMTMLVMLRERGADLNANFLDMYTPAIVAASYGRLDVLKFLMQECPTDSDELMHAACSHGRKNIVQFLLEENHYRNIDGFLKDRKETPLHIAAAHGRLTIVKYLVDEHSIDVDIKSGNGETPMEMAIARKEWTVANHLLNMQSNVQGERGGLMVRRAGKSGQWSLVRRLIESGADFDTAWDDNDFPIASIAACNNHFETLHYLLHDKQYDVQKLNTPSFFKELTKYANRNVLHYLHSEGLKLDAIHDENGGTGLHFAAAAGNIDACEFFVTDMKYDVDNADFNGCSALHYAVQRNQLSSVEYFLGHNANAVKKNNAGETPLKLAFRAKNQRILDNLANHADLSKEFPDEDGNHFLYLLLRSNFTVSSWVYWFDKLAVAEMFHKNNAGETILHAAARLPDELLTIILTKAQEIASDSVFKEFLNGKDRNGNTPLMITCSTKNVYAINVAKTFIKYESDLNAQNCHQQTVLHLAIEQKNYELLHVLLEPYAQFMKTKSDTAKHGLPDPRLKDENGLTPVELAQKLGTKDIENLMLNYDQNYKLNVLQDEAEKERIEAAMHAYYSANLLLNPLFKAVQTCSTSKCESLLRQFPELLAGPFIGPYLPIHEAADAENLEILKLLLSYASDIEAKSKHGDTPLHIAASCGRLAAFRYLITAGAKLDTFNNQGSKPVHAAIRSGRLNILDYAFAEGLFDVNDLDEFSATPLQIAAEEGCNDIIEYLLDKYESDAFPLSNCDILNEAVCNMHLSTVQLLLDKNALEDVMKAGVYKKSPLYLAVTNEQWIIAALILETATQDQLMFFLAKHGPNLLVEAARAPQLNVVKLLVEKGGVDPNFHGNEEASPLIAACFTGDKAVIEYLLSRNASTHAFNRKTHETALHMAAKRGHTNIVQILIDFHADISALDRDKRTPLEVAVAASKWDVAALILSNAGPHKRDLIAKLPVLLQQILKSQPVTKSVMDS